MYNVYTNVSLPYLLYALTDFHETSLKCWRHWHNWLKAYESLKSSTSRLKVLASVSVSAPYLLYHLKDEMCKSRASYSGSRSWAYLNNKFEPSLLYPLHISQTFSRMLFVNLRFALLSLFDYLIASAYNAYDIDLDVPLSVLSDMSYTTEQL